MRYFILLVFAVYGSICYANMAKPYTDVTSHSILFTQKKLSVVKEYIHINISENTGDNTFEEGCYNAKFSIAYQIYSEQAIKLPLLFIGLGSPWSDTISVNGKLIKETTAKKILDNNTLKSFDFIKSYRDDLVEISYAKNESALVDLNNLIYFEANLSKGLNIVHVVYNTNMGSNNYGFVRYHNIEYSLYPSQFWQAFGPINIDLELPKNMVVNHSSIGDADSIRGNHHFFTITKIPTENLKLGIGPKISIVSSVLLTLHPFGIALLVSFIFVFFHFKLIKKHRAKKQKRFNWYLLIGNILIPVLYYVFFFISFGLIHLVLGSNSLNRHGYIFLLIVTLPVAWLFYSIIMWLVDSYWKDKFRVDL